VTANAAWPPIPYDGWRTTKDTFHLYTQVAGKLRLALSPPEPEWGHVALYVTSRGLTTSPIPYAERTFEVQFDLIDHALRIDASDGQMFRVALEPRTVADFFGIVMDALRALGIEVEITRMPSEIANPIPFDEDVVHASYDAALVREFWAALVQADRVLKVFRGSFLGRSTSVNFFWGTFDLAHTRYSGRPADPPPGSGMIYRHSADAELFCTGFWPGDDRLPEPAFFAYAYPRPDGIGRAEVDPPAAAWHDGVGEFILRYEDVRAAESPDDYLLAFVRSTYAASATLAGWDRGRLEPERT
jgi:Family of unknown function (DUF5996)